MLEKFERYPLTFGPTHIEKLERLTQHLEIDTVDGSLLEDSSEFLASDGMFLKSAARR